MAILKHTRAALVSALVGAAVAPVLLCGSALSFQLYRTCHGKHCLDRYKVADGSYQIPGVACFHPIAFYSPGKYEKHPKLAREYFIILYGFVVGDALVIYVRDQDQYLVLWHHYGNSPDLDQVEPEACMTDFKFKINDQ
jgi:hypothetical protein